MNLEQYRSQVELLLEVLASVATEPSLALKGGTAINLFVRDMPRLSVDIDLTYLGDEPRSVALPLVEQALHRIKDDIARRLPKTKVFGSQKSGLGSDMKLFVNRGDTRVVIEANPVIRGTLFPSEKRTLAPAVVAEFEFETEMAIVHLGDLYGGKIVAALDRQHPRDLFDVMLLLKNEGMTEEIHDGCITYLISHDRSLHEVIRPNLKDQRSLFDSQFEGMTNLPFSYEDFENIRDQLIDLVRERLSDRDRKFLESFVMGEPNWALAPHTHMQDLAAIRWKLQNISKLDVGKRSELARKLTAALK